MEKIVDLKKLFNEKRYEELINIIDTKIPYGQKNSSIFNLLGACRLLNGKTDIETLSLAIKDFRSAYLMEKNTANSRQAFVNFINTSISLCNHENLISKTKNSFELFSEAVNHFEENEYELIQDKKIIFAIIRVYKKLIETKKVRYYFSYLVKNNLVNSFVLTNYIYINCFFKDWTQEQFLKYGKILNNLIPEYPEDKFIPINKIKKQKIRIGFISADIKKNIPSPIFLNLFFKIIIGMIMKFICI